MYVYYLYIVEAFQYIFLYFLIFYKAIFIDYKLLMVLVDQQSDMKMCILWENPSEKSVPHFLF